VLQDLRFAVRMLIKHRSMTAAAVVALALGIGANATVFTLVNAVLIRGLPYPDSDRIIAVSTLDERDRERGTSYKDFIDFREGARAFSTLSAFTGSAMTLADAEHPPERFPGAFMSADGFAGLGAAPILGRQFTAADDRPGTADVVLIGYSVWANRYQRNPAIVGQKVRINGVPVTLVGVMPEGFRFPFNTDVWQPLRAMPGLEEQSRDRRFLQVLGRLAPGVTLDQATADLTAVTTRLATEYPTTNSGIRPRLMAWAERQNGGPIRLMFLALMGAVAFVLLIACANVASLLLARAAERSPEMAVRVSIGATRWQIVRQLLTESVLLALIGGAVGLGLAVIGINLFDNATSDPALGKPYWIQFTFDWRVVAFFAVICVVTGLIFGLAPALHVARGNVAELLKEGGRSGIGGIRARRWTSVLLTIEVALTLVLLAGAGFMMRSFVTLYSLDLGFDASRLTVTRFDLPQQKYATPESRIAFIERVEERLDGIPALQTATIAGTFPLGGGAVRLLSIDGRPRVERNAAPTVTAVVIGRRYFETLGVAVQGRAFSREDGTAGREVAIVNARFAAMHFPNGDAMGQRIQLTDEGVREGPAPPWLTIVGIAPTIRQRNPQDLQPDAVVYLPYRGDPIQVATILARGEGGPGAIGSILRNEMRALDPDLPLFDVRTLNDQLALSRWPYRVFGAMFTIFAGVALLLSAVGLYAVTSRTVVDRTREIGVRLVLGARPSEIQWLIVRQGALKVVIGLVVGIAGAFGVGRLLQTFLVQMSPRDPVTLGAIALLLAAVAAAACVWPARRACRLDPMVALRSD
jgi:predicted permease